MARYNTVIPTTSTTTTATVSAPLAGAFTKFTGTTYTVTIGDPVLFSGQSQTFYNAASGTITITSGGTGTFRGPGGSTTANQTLPTGTTLTIYSDGTNWITMGAGGGPLTATTGTFSGGVSGITTLSASGAVTFTGTTGVDLAVSSTDDSTSASTGSITTAGGIAVNKNISIGKAGNTGLLRLLGSTSGTVTFQAAATTTGGTYTLPAADGTNGYALVTNGSGTLSWAAAGATLSDDTSTTTLYPTMSTSTSGSLTTAKISSTKMTFNASTGTLTTTAISTGTLTETSSIVFKENLNPITGALDKILQLASYTYDRKDGSSKNEAGLIAEDVNKVIPNLVTLDKDGNPFGIQYTKLTAYLVEAVKSLKEEINQLKGNK